jgi:hypothetical protein
MACSSSEVIQSKATISSDKMVEILTQRQLIVSEFNTFQYQGEFSQNKIDSLLTHCHQDLGYSNDDFQQSWQFYTSEGHDELIVIYDKVLQELELMQEKSKN